LPYESKVKLEVLDVYGNVVKTLVDDVLPAGEYNTILWDGTDASGNLAPSGNYIYRLTANGKTLTGIMTLVR
jgi:flagellar hook assembly protein FlgD